MSWTLWTHALLRITTGIMFIPHGYQKFFGLGDKAAIDFGFMTIAAVIELVGGIMILAGFMTRQVAFLCSGFMAAAYFMSHASNGPAFHIILPILNNGEKALLYCFIFLFLCANGPGCCSIDGWMAQRKTSR